MHELYTDCCEAAALLIGEEIPSWILDVMNMPIVNGRIPSDHGYAPAA